MRIDISCRLAIQATVRRVILGGAGCLLLAGCVTEQPVRQAKDVSNLDRSLYQAAESFEKRRDYATAVSYYRNIYRRDPGDTDAVVGLSRGLRHLQQAREAQAIVLRALKETPKHHDLRAELGKVQLALGEPLKAVDTLSRVDSEIDGKRWDIKVALAIGHDRVGLYEQAERRYRQALVLSPENAVIMNNFALSLAQAGRLGEALDILERAAALPEATPRMRQNLAFLYAMKGDLASAEKYVRRDLPPDMADQNMNYYRQLREGMQGRKKTVPLPALPAMSKARKEKPAVMQPAAPSPPPAEIVASKDAPMKAAPKPGDTEESTAKTAAGTTEKTAKSAATNVAVKSPEKAVKSAEKTVDKPVPAASVPASTKLPADTTKSENAMAASEQTSKRAPDQKPRAMPPVAETAKPEPAAATTDKPKSQTAETPAAAPAPEPTPPPRAESADAKAGTPDVKPSQATTSEAVTSEAKAGEKAPSNAEKPEGAATAETPPRADSAEATAAAAPKTAAEPKVAALTVKGYRLQLGSFKSLDWAEALRRRLLKEHPDLLREVDLVVETVTVPERGDFFRVNSRPVPNREMVDETCLKLAIRDVPCLLVSAP